MTAPTPPVGSGGFRTSLVTEDIGVSAQASFLASEHYIAKRGGITLDNSKVSADGNGDKIVAAGTCVVPISGSSKYQPYATTGGVNEVQVLTVSATSGTFTLAYQGEVTDAIAENAAASVVQAALLELPSFQPGDVTVTGSAGGPYTITFGGRYEHQTVETLTGASVDLGGGSSSATVAESIAGTAATVAAGAAEPADGVILFESVNLRHGDVVCGALYEGSVLSARLTGVDDAFKLATAGRISYQ